MFKPDGYFVSYLNCGKRDPPLGGMYMKMCIRDRHRPVFGAQKRIGVAQGADALQPARGAPAQSRHSGQRAFVGAEHAVNAAKLLVQRVGQGVDIAAGDGIIEQQFQKLMRPQIVYALQERAPAQALAVAGVGAIRR